MTHLNEQHNFCSDYMCSPVPGNCLELYINTIFGSPEPKIHKGELIGWESSWRRWVQALVCPSKT